MTSTIPPHPAQPLPGQLSPVRLVLRPGQGEPVPALGALGYPTLATARHGEVQRRAGAPIASAGTVTCGARPDTGVDSVLRTGRRRGGRDR